MASWFGFCMTLTDSAPFSMEKITGYLQERGIETRPIIAGNMARHPALKMYRHRISGTLENCDTVMQCGFAIGCHQAIETDAVNYVTECFDLFMKDRRWEDA